MLGQLAAGAGCCFTRSTEELYCFPIYFMDILFEFFSYTETYFSFLDGFESLQTTVICSSLLIMYSEMFKLFSLNCFSIGDEIIVVYC